MRIDKYLVGKYFSSRTKAARAISEGLVKRNGKTALPSDEVKPDDLIEVMEKTVSFVSEGGFKLDKALSDFGDDVKNLIFADIGASTGGFTDCLLQRGAKRVYAIDVGESQLDNSLVSDDRVIVMDNTNARYLSASDFQSVLDGIVADVSFISLKYLMPVISALLNNSGCAYLLIKPQFECGRSALDKHGIVKDMRLRKKAILDVVANGELYGLFAVNVTEAPIKQNKNVEYVVKFVKSDIKLNNETFKKSFNFLK